ncbi:glycosyltransferase [Methanoregula sp.]|uniref:glycosyltransferase n=1 Tax=Methanoregula sp. TaxID=2052170 RepID=UPI003C6EBB6F
MTDSAPDTNPLVSVIIPVYNGQRYIAETIDSVISQTMEHWEIIAVNDGSTDGSSSILEKYAGKMPGRIRPVTVENGGVSRARNKGAALARGKYLAFLDQDDLWAPGKLRSQVDFLDRNEGVGIVFSNETLIDENGRITRKCVLRLGSHQRGPVFENLLFGNFIPVSSVMVRKDLFCRAGGFDPKFSLAEDFDLLLRISREVPVDYIDEPLLFYREHRESGTSTKIDRITAEALEILRSWREKDPSVFRKHFLKYQKFRMNFAVLKCKVVLKRWFSWSRSR